MNYFSKRTTSILVPLSIVCLLAGSLLVLFSQQSIAVMYTFLSKSIFHREFSLEKWLPTIESFFMIPLFTVVFFNALVFHKYTEKIRLLMVSVLFAVIAFMIIYVTATRSDAFVNTDLAAEFLLAKECVLEKSLWPRGWCYSTEIRLLNTQLFSAPLFLFTDSWTVNKVFTTICTCAVLFWACWYLLQQTDVKGTWLKLLASLLIICPFSEIAWYVGTWGTYYVPHAVMSIVYVATFVKLHYKQPKHAKILTYFFYIWGFLSGLSSIRYIMLFVFPLCITAIVIECHNKKDITQFKAFWINTPTVFTSCIGLFASGFGYVCNNVVLQHLYTFSQWNTINFTTFGHYTVTELISALLHIFGFQDGIAVMTPGGIVNILVYAALVLFIINVVASFKGTMPISHRTILTFVVSSYAFNTFVYFNTDFIARYYYPLVVYIIPCIAILIQDGSIKKLQRYFMVVAWAVVLIISTFALLQNKLHTDNNTHEYGALHFLQDNDYTFGYATFWHTNVFTYLSNGKIAIGNLLCTDSSKLHFTDSFAYDTWLTPKRYYTDDFAKGKVFLLVTNEQAQTGANHGLLQNGHLVYEDSYYKIYDYPSNQAFKDSYKSTR
ncbi:MAG: hypothetical protein K6E51_11120 [Treponema sp.]|nr:hypothetical protein [Treponema sp.]